MRLRKKARITSAGDDQNDTIRSSPDQHETSRTTTKSTDIASQEHQAAESIERTTTLELEDNACHVLQHDFNVPLSARRNRLPRNSVDPTANTTGGQASGDVRNGAIERNNSSANADTNETILPAFNLIKAQLLEAQRDKRVYAATVLSQSDKIEALQRELQQRNHHILSLEVSLNKKGSRSAKKGDIWSQERLGDAGLGEYQGICLAVGRIASNEATYLVTESFIDSDCNNIRRRDWRSSATAVSLEVSKASLQYIKLPNGISAIPSCVMGRALQLKFYSSPYKNQSGFLRDCIRKVLSSPAASFMSEDEKRSCEAKVASHRPTNQKLRSIISDRVGNIKKIARNTYLRSLGYYNAVRSSSKKDTNTVHEMRENEKRIIFSRCIRALESGTLSTTFWRISVWRDLCYEVSDENVANEMVQAEEQLEKDKKVDCWFFNEAARRAFLELQGYSNSNSSIDFANDSSLLTIARADAAMTTMLRMINVGGRGGKRNNGFIESFRTLLPLALEVLIKEIWTDISEKATHELSPFIGDSKENDDDPFGNNLRDFTVVHVNPDDSYVYLVASAKYLQEHVCSWIGKIKDAHIGRRKQNEEEFTMINKHMIFDEDEMSDVDVLSCENIDETEIEDGGTPSSTQTRREDLV